MRILCTVASREGLGRGGVVCPRTRLRHLGLRWRLTCPRDTPGTESCRCVGGLFDRVGVPAGRETHLIVCDGGVDKGLLFFILGYGGKQTCRSLPP